MAQDLTHPVALVTFGLFIGFIGSLIGVGGGFLMIPWFQLVLGWPLQLANGMSLSVIAANASSGVVSFASQKRIDYLVGAALGVAALPGTYLGKVVADRIASGPFKIAFAGIGLIAAALMILGKSSTRPGLAWCRRGVRRQFVDAVGESYDYSLNLWAAAALSVIMGFISALFGVGGGFIHVPILILLFGLPAHVSMATSHFVLLITAVVGAVEYAIDGKVTGLHFLYLGLGAVAGAQVGARLAARLAGQTLRRIFGVILIAVAAIMAWRGVRETA